LEGAAPSPHLRRAVGLRLLASGLLVALAFPPFHLGPIIFIALIPFFDAVRLVEATPRSQHRALSWLLYLGAMLHFALLLYWILFLPPEEVTVPGLIILAFALMVAYLGIFVFLAQAAARRAHRLGVPLWLALPIAWVAAEYLRSQTQLGFPWVLVGYGLIETPTILQFLSISGIFGASLLVCLVNGLLHAALLARGRRRLAFAGLALALPAAALGHGFWAIAALEPAETSDVVVVQGNIRRDVKFKAEYRLRNVDQMIMLSEQGIFAGTTPPALVVWPETATPCYLRLDPGCLLVLQRFVDRVGVPLLTGIPDVKDGPDGSRRHTNAAALIAPERGIVARYEKVNLVPFGEAIPYQDRIPFLESIDFGEADFHRGPGFTPIATDGDTLGVMICFESIFPAIGRAYARAGARFLVNITNDEWFGESAGPYQHAAMAVARSIETRRGLARSANTGVSFVVDRVGRVHEPTALFTPAVVRAPVELGEGTTGYMRIGDLVPQLCLAASLLAWMLAHRRPRRSPGGLTRALPG
jgi:apolipoprotein N-acyltransferase